MSIFVNNLPPLPDNPNRDKFLLIYSNDSYYCTFYDSMETSPVNGYYHFNSAVEYVYWENHSCWYRITLSTPDPISEKGVENVILCSDTLYRSDGSIAVSASPEQYNSLTGFSLVGDCITSSTVSSTLNQVLFILPLVVLCLVGLFGIRKAWNFFSSLLGGA